MQRCFSSVLAKANVALAAGLVFLHLGLASAQAQTVEHYNAVELKRVSSTTVQFAFTLNLPQVLHVLLAPQLAYPVFLRAYAEMPDPAFEKEIAKAGASLSAKAFFTLSSGATVRLKHWQWPERHVIRDLFNASLVLLKMPPNSNVHLDPVPVLAQAQGKIGISRAQLQLSPALFPIVVSLPNDKFWLTEQIPMALVELP